MQLDASLSYTAGKDLGKIQSQRELDLLNLAFQAQSAKHGPAGIEELYVDISQSANHAPWTSGHLRSITTSASFFAFHRSRLLLPQELFRVLGFEGLNVSTVSRHAQQQMLGECMSLSCLATIIYGVLTSLPEHWSKSAA